MRDKSNPVAAGPQPPLVPLWEVGAAARPGYSWGGLPELAAELAEVAEGLGLEVTEDWGQRPCLTTTDDAARLYRHLTEPRPAPVEAPHVRGFVPGPSVPDPSTEKAEVY